MEGVTVMIDETVLIVGRDARFLKEARLALAGLEAALAIAPDPANVEASARYAVVVMELNEPEFEGAELIRRFGDASPFTECIIASRTPAHPVVEDLCGLRNVYSVHDSRTSAAAALCRDVARALERRALRRHNAYLLIELRDARDELRDQTEFLAQVERLATVGQMVEDLVVDLAPKLAALRNAIAQIEQACGTCADVPEMARRVTGLTDLAEECRQGCHALADFARGGTGMVEPVALRNVVHDALALMGHSLTAHSIRIRIDVPKSLPQVLGNPFLLRQALIHVLINSVQAMPHGGVLTIQGECSAAGDGGVRLLVADTGPGMPPEVLDHAFDAFFTTRPSGQGSGLGLTVARKILRDHGGDVLIASRVGRGTTCTLHVPVMAEAVSQVNVRAAA